MDCKKKVRNSNLELYRVIVMLLIVAHHYVVNSGLFGIMQQSELTYNSAFLYLFGMWGKTGINCFVLITGYFMCKSEATIAKFLKLLFEVVFYKVVIYLVFVLCGVAQFELTSLIKAFSPISNVGDGFTTAFILFYLFIPFINILVHNLKQTQHILLIVLSLFIYTFWYMLPFFEVRYNYITWFVILYLIASYIRFYPPISAISWGLMTILMVIVSSSSVIVLKVIGFSPFYFVSDSNAVLALCTAVCSFMYFKDLKIKQSRLINILGASTFGVLLIHANSDTMRQWLWCDTLRNSKWIDSSYCVFHALFSVIAVFALCSALDFLRLKYLERPFFKSSIYNNLECVVRRLLNVAK